MYSPSSLLCDRQHLVLAGYWYSAAQCCYLTRRFIECSDDPRPASVAGMAVQEGCILLQKAADSQQVSLARLIV